MSAPDHGITVAQVQLPASRPFRASCLCGWTSPILAARPHAITAGQDHIAELPAATTPTASQLPCAPWCQDPESDMGCDSDGHCYAKLDVLTSTVGSLHPDERGRGRRLQITTGLQREAGAFRPANLPYTELHVIILGVGLEGWDNEPFVELTPAQAESLRDRLDHLVRIAREDAEAIRDHDAAAGGSRR